MACCAFGRLVSLTLLIGLIAETYALQCYTCHGASSDVECNQNIELCTPDKQACSTQVWGGRVSKLCMARDECLLRHQDECSDNGECAQCCTSDLCNRKTNTKISEYNNGLANTTVKASACSSFPCQNGGKCTDFCGCASCECVPGFTGEYCEYPYDVCEPSFCLNGGTEIVACLCPEGTTGQYCETSTCFPACQNGGMCVGNPDSVCLCPPEFTGIACETPNPCIPDPCINGVCYGDGLCLCQPGYTGEFCENIIDPCVPNPCQNGGLCSNGICQCPPIYGGPTCEVCLCQNNGNCMEDNTCLCIPPYWGEFCGEYIPPGEGYDCEARNPCFQFSVDNGLLLWPAVDCSKYIQCVPGPPIQCWEQPCAPGQYWDICENTCNVPDGFNCPEGLERCELNKKKRRAARKRTVSKKNN